MSQLTFFPEPAPVEPVVDDEARALAARLPAGVRFGCCTWTFPGWAGLVYRGRPSLAQLQRHGLRACSRWPLFGAVEMDHTFYRPPSADDLRRLARELPPGFPALSKVWSELTTHTFPNHPRLGDRAGLRNHRFLDPALAREVVAPYVEAFTEHAGPLIFQLPPVPDMAHRDPAQFARLVDRLLGALPSEPDANAPALRYAFELRNRELLTPRYLEVLAAHGAAHVISFYPAMPPIGEQLALDGIFGARFAVARLLHPPGTDYESRRTLCEPFDALRDPQPQMRADVRRLADACVADGRELFVMVDNKAEGSAPLTVRALAELIARPAS
ncbi:MAG TPA: DUF72 domain-containing protein [Polyangia bacterium]|nr:DUF72 domain-containing protein [Polyangia bacterium]